MDWNQYLNNLSTSPMFNMGMGMLQASGPSMQPVGFGQSLASGMQTMGQAKHQQQAQALYQAEMDRMNAKTKQEQEAAAQAKAQREAMFSGAPTGPQQGGQPIPDPMRSTGLQQWLGTPGAKAMYDQAPTQFWQQYNEMANPKPVKPEYREVGKNLLSIGPDGKPHVIYSAPQEGGGSGFRMMSPDEVVRAGLPKGTVAQLAPNGKVQILSKGEAEVTPPGDPTKTGDEYLATLPASMREVVRRIASGDQAPPSSSSRSPEAQALLQAVYTYDPSSSAINLPARTATRKDFTSGKSANNIRSLNQAIGHLGVLLDQIPHVAGHSIPFVGKAVNAAQNKYAENSGDPGITNYESTAEALAGEMTQVFRGNAGAEADIKRNLEHLNPNYSTAQKEEAAKNIIRLFNSRIQELGQQYSQGMGRTVDPYSLINPHAAEILKKVGVADEGGAQPSGGNGWAIQKVSN